MREMSRRDMLATAAGATALFSANSVAHGLLADEPSHSDSLPMQLYKGLNDQQRAKICLPVDHPSRGFVSNWWYVHREHRINNTFNGDQKELIQNIFDSLHHEEHREAVNDQVRFDQYGQAKNAPSVGFFGSPDDEDFEFIYTGHHVTRRCNAHLDKGIGFCGRPIFYGHFREKFHEEAHHPGNHYWYQGKVFNEFVQGLNGEQQAKGLASSNPRSENSKLVILKKQNAWPGLSCAELSADQKKLFLDTVRKMLVMFRKDDVDATLKTIQQNNLMDQLYVSWYSGKYDIGGDQVWDTWQIEGPKMVWYFRGQPHIHSYFHLKV